MYSYLVDFLTYFLDMLTCFLDTHSSFVDIDSNEIDIHSSSIDTDSYEIDSHNYLLSMQKCHFGLFFYLFGLDCFVPCYDGNGVGSVQGIGKKSNEKKSEAYSMITFLHWLLYLR